MITDSKRAKISIACETYQINGEFCATIAGIYAYSRKSEKDARDLLAKKFRSTTLKQERAEKHAHQHTLICSDGTVMVCLWKNDTYCYAITGAGREHASYCQWNWETLEAVVADAKKHAEQSYNGVISEFRI